MLATIAATLSLHLASFCAAYSIYWEQLWQACAHVELTHNTLTILYQRWPCLACRQYSSDPLFSSGSEHANANWLLALLVPYYRNAYGNCC
jgi:phage terminase small subunit